MSTKIEASLRWPASWPRTPATARERSLFGKTHSGDVSLADARHMVDHELRLLGAANAAITCNVGSGSIDPGVAVWFEINGEPRVVACDRWLSVAENLHAIVLTIEAMRGMARWGVGQVVERASAGFMALPAGSSAATEIQRSPYVAATGYQTRQPIAVIADWRKVLRAEPGDDLAAVKRRFRRLMSAVHPDQGGRDAIAARLNAAMADAARELGDVS
jgi:DnaJ-domain-containing protein 1